MSAVARNWLNTRNSTGGSILVAGLLIGIADAIIYHWIVCSLIGGHPLITVYQYLASGALGSAAFEGGIPAAMLGLFFHFVVAFAVAGVFILSAERIPLLRRHAIPGSLVYGFGVFIVMNMIVMPLTAAPTMPELIVNILDHVLVVGLPLGILVRRSTTNP